MGEEIIPRGQKCREACDYSMLLDMRSDSVITSFRARKLNLDYAKQEFLWYLRGDRFDTSIEKHATVWRKIRQSDGGYNSNYGQYIFTKPSWLKDGPTQFQWVVDCLKSDRHSRQASIVLLNRGHLVSDNPDVVCTYAINFRIRAGQLDMTVMMRSNDCIWGLTNDTFCFIMLYRMMFQALFDRYPLMTPGSYHHFVNSLHVYERHYQMIEEIIEEGETGHYQVTVPWPSIEEVGKILSSEEPSAIHGPMTEWLNGADEEA